MARHEAGAGALGVLLAEAREAGRAGVQSFKGFWLERVCQDGRRRGLITQGVHDEALAAYRAGAGEREGGA